MEQARFRVGQTDIVIHEGDIATIQVDAMITAINSGGMWFGGIDGVIKRAAGNMFHSQASQAMPLEDGQTVPTRKQTAHHGAWNDVLFVVDDLQRPLGWIIERALRAASQEGYTSVSLPAIRTGVMLGVVEPTAQAAVDQIGMGLRNFLLENSTSLREIHFVIFRSPEILQLMASGSIAEA